MNTIAERIQHLRESIPNEDGTGMSQYEFAKAVGLAASTISTLERGGSEPSGAVIAKIKESFPNVDLNWLFTGLGDPFIDMKVVDQMTAQHQKQTEHSYKIKYLELLEKYTVYLEKDKQIPSS